MIARRQRFDVFTNADDFGKPLGIFVGGKWYPIQQTQRESVMQEMQRPDGSALNELFTGEQVANGAAERRRKLLEQIGYKFVDLKPVSENKYATPHQGSKEIARRVKQILRQAQKATEPT